MKHSVIETLFCYRKLQPFAVLELKIHLSAYLSTTGRASCGWNPAHGTVMYAFLASVPCVLWNVKYTCIVYFLQRGSIALWTNPACGKTQIHQLLVSSLRAGARLTSRIDHWKKKSYGVWKLCIFQQINLKVIHYFFHLKNSLRIPSCLGHLTQEFENIFVQHYFGVIY